MDVKEQYKIDRAFLKHLAKTYEIDVLNYRGARLSVYDLIEMAEENEILFLTLWVEVGFDSLYEIALSWQGHSS